MLEIAWCGEDNFFERTSREALKLHLKLLLSSEKACRFARATAVEYQPSRQHWLGDLAPYYRTALTWPVQHKASSLSATPSPDDLDPDSAMVFISLVALARRQSLETADYVSSASWSKNSDLRSSMCRKYIKESANNFLGAAAEHARVRKEP